MLTEGYKKAYDETYEHMASRGHRVLGFAEFLLPGDKYPEDFVFDKKAKNYPLGDFIFVGLASLQDPPKHGVREAIGKCREAGKHQISVPFLMKHTFTTGACPMTLNLALDKNDILIFCQVSK